VSITIELIIIFGILLTVMFLGAPVKSAMGFYGRMHDSFIQWDGALCPGLGSSPYPGHGHQPDHRPMFILMAYFLSRGPGIAEDFFAVLNRGIGKFRGGLAISTTLACTVFCRASAVLTRHGRFT
jgi:hypothetical protein